MQEGDMEKLLSIVYKLGITIGFSLVLIFVAIRLVAETPIEPEEKHPSAYSQICWYVIKYYDINGDIVGSSAKETDCGDITPTVHGQTAPTTSTIGIAAWNTYTTGTTK